MSQYGGNIQEVWEVPFLPTEEESWLTVPGAFTVYLS